MNRNVKDLFRKTCINELPSYEYIPKEYSRDGETVHPRIYRREDFSKFAKEAFERGEKFFYTEPVDPENPNGPHRLCEPKYVYTLKKSLSEEEFERYFGWDAFIETETPEGTLSAHISSDPNNPGLYIELTPKDTDYVLDMALVEHNEMSNKMTTFVWGDAMEEDYSLKVQLSNLDKYRESLEEMNDYSDR